MCLVSLQALDVAEETRGLYFDKEKYEPLPIPTFEEAKEVLPVPVYEEHPEYLDMYWRAWEIAVSHIKRPPEGSPLLSDFLDENFMPRIYQWDTSFMMLFAKYGDAAFPFINSLDNFYGRQYPDGFIARTITEAEGKDITYVDIMSGVNPPLYAWAEYEYYRMSGDVERLKMVVKPITKYAEWLETGRKNAHFTKHHLYWQTNMGSGMDNLTRLCEEPSHTPDYFVPIVETGWVDMSAQVAMLHYYLALICEAIGDEEKAQWHYDFAQDINDRINKYMWDEETGYYYDVDKNGEQIDKERTIATVWPMLSGAPSSEQAEAIVSHLKDPNQFWTPMVFPALSADEEHFHPYGGYWLGGVWAPSTFATIKALERYGYHEFAREATLRHLEGLYKVFDNEDWYHKGKPTLYENYSPMYPRPGGRGEDHTNSRPDFVGWTGCGPITLMIENVIGIKPDAVDNTIHWHILSPGKSGVENLRMNDNVISMIADKDSFNAIHLTIETEEAFTLHIIANGTEHEGVIAPGKSEYRIEPDGSKINL